MNQNSPQFKNRCIAARLFLQHEVAKKRATIFYKDLWEIIGSNRFEIAYILGTIVTMDKAEGLPLLSSLVISKEKGKPSFGFYEMGGIVGITSNITENEFIKKNQQECWSYYSK